MKKFLTALVFVSALAAGTGYYLNWFGPNNEEEVLSWEVFGVKRRDISTSVLATGIVKPSIGAEVKVGSRVSGLMKKLYVKIGDSVKKGQLLAELDPTEFNARCNQLLATLNNSEVNKKFAKINFDRQKQLNDKNVSSRAALDNANMTYEVAESQVKIAQANLEIAKIQLSYTKIYAPMSGVVGSIATQEGETVVASFAAPDFLTIINLNRLEVWAYVDETDIGRIAKNQKVEFTVDTYTNVEISGEVVAIYPKAEMNNNVVNYITIIEIINSEGLTLRPEMTATITIYLDSHKNVLTVPNKAVRRESGGKYVIIKHDDKFEKRYIKTDWKNNNYTEIIDGLSGNDMVVVGQISNEELTNGRNK